MKKSDKNTDIEKIPKDWTVIVSLIISLFVVAVSCYTIYASNRDSYLVHRAYVTTSSWPTVGLDEQASFQITNSGDTPATELRISGYLSIDGSTTPPYPLKESEGIILYPKLLLTFPWSISNDQLLALSATSSNFANILIIYKDYGSNTRKMLSKFIVIKMPSGKFQFQIIKQEEIDF